MKRRIKWIISGVSILGLAYLVSPRSVSGWYITPPLDAKGTRLKFWVPEGWNISRIDDNGYVAMFRATTQPPLLLRPLTWHSRKNIPEGNIFVSVWKTTKHHPNPKNLAVVETIRTKDQSQMEFARAIHIRSKNLDVGIFYTDESQLRFEQNSRVVADSLTVLP